VGTATLTDAAPGVRIKLDVRSLPPANIPFTFIKWRNASRRISSRQARIFPVCLAAMSTQQARRRATFRIFRWWLPRMEPRTLLWLLPNVTLGTDDHSVFSNGGPRL